MDLYYIKKGKIVQAKDALDWSTNFSEEQKKVKLTYVGDCRVSTVFLGIDHSFLDSDLPILYETMIFGGVQDQEYQERYCTKEEALIGHKVACWEAVEWFDEDMTDEV